MIVCCTVPNEEVAREISYALIKEKLCACVNKIPNIKSYYIYEDEFCEDNELLLMIKTAPSHFELLQDRIKELHPYEVPEIIATKITDSSAEYRSWVVNSLR